MIQNNGKEETIVCGEAACTHDMNQYMRDKMQGGVFTASPFQNGAVLKIPIPDATQNGFWEARGNIKTAFFHLVIVVFFSTRHTATTLIVLNTTRVKLFKPVR